MSRIGNLPIPVVDKVEVAVNRRVVTVKGPKGELTLNLPANIDARVEDGQVIVSRTSDERAFRGYHGLMRTLVANMVQGVSQGFRRDLLIEGVGFRATVQGDKLSMTLGFASPVVFPIPAGIAVTEEGGTKVAVVGIDKQLVGNTAAHIRSFYPAEPYKGKGIRYADEVVRRKVGKTVA